MASGRHHRPGREDDRRGREDDPLLRTDRRVAGPEPRDIGLSTLRSARRGAAAVHPAGALPGVAASTAQDAHDHAERRAASRAASSAARAGREQLDAVSNQIAELERLRQQLEQVVQRMRTPKSPAPPEARADVWRSTNARGPPAASTARTVRLRRSEPVTPPVGREQRVPVAVLAAAFLFNLGQGVLRPSMPLYLQRTFAANYRMVTLIPVVVRRRASGSPTCRPGTC